MNAKLVGVLCFVTGALCGGAGTFFVCKKLMDKKIDEEVEAVRDYYKGIEDQKVEEVVEYMEQKKTEEVEEPKLERVKQPVAVEPDYKDIIDKLNYNKFSTRPDDGLNEEPYIISKAEYDENNFEYEKKTVSWFMDDEVLMEGEDGNAIIHDVDREVGFGNLDLFGKSDGADEDELYVRNEKSGIDYYIILETGSYSEFMATAGDFPEE